MRKTGLVIIWYLLFIFLTWVGFMSGYQLGLEKCTDQHRQEELENVEELHIEMLAVLQAEHRFLIELEDLVHTCKKTGVTVSSCFSSP